MVKNNDPDVIVLSKTWLNKNTKSFISSYDLTQSTCSNYQGIAILVRKGLLSKVYENDDS